MTAASEAGIFQPRLYFSSADFSMRETYERDIFSLCATSRCVIAGLPESP